MEKEKKEKESLKERMSFLDIDTENVDNIKTLQNVAFESDTELQNLLTKEANRELSLVYSNNVIVALMDTTAESAFSKLAERELKSTELGKRKAVNGKLDGDDATKYNAKFDAIVTNLRTIAKNGKGRYYNYSLKKATLLDTTQRINSWAEALWTEYINRRNDASESKTKQTLTEKITAKLNAFAKVPTLSVEDIIKSVAAVCKCSESEVKSVAAELQKASKEK